MARATQKRAQVSRDTVTLPPQPANDAPLIEWALWNAEIGRRTGAFKVFPCAPGAKHPLHKGWQEEAADDPKTVKAMWRNDPHANVGLAIQPGFVAIDGDLYKPGAEAALAVFEAKHGELPRTLENRTARGGLHLIYATGAPVGNSRGTLPNFGDVRGHGGLIVGPGSVFEGKRYTVENLSLPAPLPQHVEGMLRTKSSRDRAKPDEPAPLVLIDDPRNVAFFRDWCAGTPRKTLTTPNGEVAKPCIENHGGNNTLAATGAMAHDYGLSESTALEVAFEHFNPRCEPPWDDEKFETHFLSGYRSATGRLGSRAPVLDTAKLFKPVPKSTATTDLAKADPAKADPASPGTKYLKLVEHFEGVLAASGERERRAVRFGDVPPRAQRQGAKWAIDKWLLRGATNAIFGESESYKTYVTIRMLLCVATGTPFGVYDDFKGYRVDGPRDVILFAGEGYDDVLNRIDAAIEGGSFNRALVEQHLIVVSDVYTLNFADGLAGMADEIDALNARPAIIAVDTYNLALDGNEDAADETKKALRGLRALAVMYDAAGLVLHHPGWGDKKRPRGSSAFRANADVLILCERIEDRAVLLTQYKNRSAEKAKFQAAFTASDVPLGNDPETGEAISNLSFTAINSTTAPRARDDSGAIKIGSINTNVEALEQCLLDAPAGKVKVGASETARMMRAWLASNNKPVPSVEVLRSKFLYAVRDAIEGSPEYAAAYLISNRAPLEFSHPERLRGVQREPRPQSQASAASLFKSRQRRAG